MGGFISYTFVWSFSEARENGVGNHCKTEWLRALPFPGGPVVKGASQVAPVVKNPTASAGD